MVVQEDDGPIEAPLAKQTNKYIIVKNHVRELAPQVESPQPMATESEVERKLNKKKDKNRKRKVSKGASPDSGPTDISQSHLEELRTVYKNCVAVVKKIESKYGHLLNLDNQDFTGNSRKNESSGDEQESPSCTGSLNKKIVFDENGQQLEKERDLDNHICHPKIQKKHVDSEQQNPGVHIEYDQYNKLSTELPENLEDLVNILKNPNIDYVYRKMVIDKIYLIRQNHLYELRSERTSLIEKLKENPDEILDFQGTNIATLPGYPKEPLEIRKNTNSS